MKRYHSGQQFLNPYFKTIQQHWLMQNDRWAYALSVCLVSLVIGYFAVQRHWLWIEHVEISGNQYITTSQLEQPTWKVLRSRRWFFLPQQFFFFSNSSKIKSEITNTLQDTLALEELSVTKKFPNTVVIRVQERLPGLTYILNNNYYYLDKEGIITNQLANLNEADPHFPHVRDVNQRMVKVGEAAVSPTVIDFIINLNKTFTEQVSLNISEYTLPAVTCQKKTFVAEKLITEDINNTADTGVKEQKKAILDRLQNKEITVDQSLAELEELKQSEANTNNTTNSSSIAQNSNFIAIKSQYISTDCDYTNVLRDVHVVTQEGPKIYFDASADITTQYNHLSAVLQSKIDDIKQIKYIDVRYQDKVYYQ